MYNKKTDPAATPAVQEADFYEEDGLFVFTALFHRKRGHCCKSECRHCPWGYKKPSPIADPKPQ